MYSLFKFLKSIYVLLLFLLLEGVAIHFYATSDSYTQAKILSYTSLLKSPANSLTSEIRGYFSLRSENEQLLERLVEVERELDILRELRLDERLAQRGGGDSLRVRLWAKVLSNSINRKENYIIINRGLEDGVRSGMSVLTPRGEMVGTVVYTAGLHAVVMSVLNTKFRSSAKLEINDYAGSLFWSGEDRYHLSIDDLSKYADPTLGAKVVTTSFSQLFDEGVTIGEVSDIGFDSAKNTFWVEVALAADLSALDEVIVVGRARYDEQQRLLDMIEQGGVENRARVDEK